MTDTQWSPEREYEERLAWRKKRQIENLKELAEIAHVGGGDTLKALPRLGPMSFGEDPKTRFVGRYLCCSVRQPSAISSVSSRRAS